LLEGETQIPTSYLNKLRDQKRERVINYIAEAAMNPATKTKYTTSMIESAVGRIRYNFDPYKHADTQAEEVLKLLRAQMPIAIERVRLQMKIPAQHSGAFYGAFRSYGEIKKEFYDSSGCLNMEIEITEAQKDRVIDYIKRKTNNEAEYRVVSE
jgi:ribosome maturation protein SDO1